MYKSLKKLKMFCMLLVIAICLPLVQVEVSAAPSGISAWSYIIMDADTGQILFGQNVDDQYDPASITKIMTLGLACEKAQGDWDVELTVSYEAVSSIANTGSSHIALQVGEVISLTDALYAVEMASANDAANVLAEYIGGSIEGGVAAMNAKVEELELENTHFDNPHGLNSDTHKVSASDMAEILRWAMEQPGFMELFTNTEMYIMEPTNLQSETRYFSISDSVRIGSSKYCVEEVVGSKTGYTDDSRYTYVSLAQSEGRNFICVTLHSEEKVDRYNDVAALYEYAFAHFTAVEIEADGASFSVDVYGGNAQLGSGTVTSEGTSFYLYDGEGADTITVEYNVPTEYILGGSYDASVTYILPASSNQQAFSIEVPLALTGVEDLLAANEGIALPASFDLLPKEKLPFMVIMIPLVILLLLVGVVVVVVVMRNRPKRRYQRLHKYRR